MSTAPTRKQEVLDALRRAILDGDLPPGAILNEVTLAREYGVSVTPVREALLALISEELVTRAPNQRARVAALGSRQAADLLDTNGLLVAGMIRRVDGVLTAQTAATTASKFRDSARHLRAGEREESDQALGAALRLLMTESRNGELNSVLRSLYRAASRRLRLISFAPVAPALSAAFERTADLLEARDVQAAAATIEDAFLVCTLHFSTAETL